MAINVHVLLFEWVNKIIILSYIEMNNYFAIKSHTQQLGLMARFRRNNSTEVF